MASKFQLIPSIDIYNGRVVRLTNGLFDKSSITYYDYSPLEYAKNLIKQGCKRIHIVDLNGARTCQPNKTNWDEIYSIVDYATWHNVCVDAGGGIRTRQQIVSTIIKYNMTHKLFKLNIGTIAFTNKKLVSNLVEFYGGDKFVISLDIDNDGNLLVDGWQRAESCDIFDLFEHYSKLGVKDFIVTNKSVDGTLSGFSTKLFENEKYKELINNINISISGGCRDYKDIYNLKQSGFLSCIVGKAINEGYINLKVWNKFEELNPDFNIKFGKENFIPAIVQDSDTHKVLMLGYMNFESLIMTLDNKNGDLVTFYSRSRKTYWTKGETSGNFLHLKSIKSDCDNDTLLLEVKPDGPVCHKGTDTCFNEDNDQSDFFKKLQNKIQKIKNNEIKSSGYTKELLDSNQKVEKKLLEEAGELMIESIRYNDDRIIYEGADLIYNFITLLTKHNISLEDIENELKDRENKYWKKHD